MDSMKEASITRYHYDDDGLWESPTGDVVKYEDHLLALSLLTAEPEPCEDALIKMKGDSMELPHGKLNCTQCGIIIQVEKMFNCDFCSESCYNEYNKIFNTENAARVAAIDILSDLFLYDSVPANEDESVIELTVHAISAYASRRAQEARADERRRCADRAIDYLRKHRFDEDEGVGMCSAILQGTEPAKVSENVEYLSTSDALLLLDSPSLSRSQFLYRSKKLGIRNEMGASMMDGYRWHKQDVLDNRDRLVAHLKEGNRG